MSSMVTNLCLEKEKSLLSQWVDAFFSAYPIDSIGFLRTGANNFSNPVGGLTRDCLATLYQAVAGCDVEPEQVQSVLDRLFHMRAVQDIKASQAVGALCLLKPLLRKHILPEIQAEQKSSAKERQLALDEYLALESRIDTLTLLAFDIYASSREQVINLRVEEVKRGQSQVVRWAKLHSGKHLPDGEKTCNEGVEE